MSNLRYVLLPLQEKPAKTLLKFNTKYKTIKYIGKEPTDKDIIEALQQMCISENSMAS